MTSTEWENRSLIVDHISFDRSCCVKIHQKPVYVPRASVRKQIISKMHGHGEMARFNVDVIFVGS